MQGKAVYYYWNGDDSPPLIAREIAEQEGIDANPIRRWLRNEGGDVKKVKAIVKAYKAQKSEGSFKVKLYPYPDESPPRLLPIRTIHQFHKDLSIPLLRQRYRISDPPCEWDEIFKPKGKPRPSNGKRIPKEELANLGPRRDINTIPGPSEYEKNLWRQ